MNRLTAVFLSVIISSFGMGFGLPFQKATTTPEYQVKAVFLFNFTQFVEWPVTVFQGEETPLVIGILGTDPFGKYLDETVRDEKINGHPLKVQRFTTLDEIKTCHILFISQGEKNKLKDILLAIKGRDILTVSDMPNFAKLGGMILLLKDNNKTKIKINLDATKNTNLTISSKLLRLAEIVSTPK